MGEREAAVKALVTGAGGFVGGAVTRLLLARGDAVRSLARGDYPELAALGVEARRGDVADAGAVADAVAGCDVVFHVAAKAGVWGPYPEYHRVNVVGTRNVIAACREHRVPRLVYTSTPSVVYGDGDLEGVDESVPYPDRYLAPYPETKAVAERAVLAANDAGLATVALRPHLVWGPGDNHLVPRIVARGRAGRLRRIGARECRVDATYIDDAARAHVLAADALDAGRAGGKAYFIAQGEPIPVWTLVDRILAAAGVAPVAKSISPGMAYAAGAVLETVYGLLGIHREPPMTRFVAKQLSTAHWFDLSAARRDLGYAAETTLDEGLDRLAAWLQRP